ncbi:glycosyltransferase family 2 protein, partial [Streptomyces sp. NPDC054802]
MSVQPRTSVVVITRDRRDQLLRTLDHLAALPERPVVIVVDNGSRGGTPRRGGAPPPPTTFKDKKKKRSPPKEV